MTNEEYINQIIEIGNTLQIHPNSPKGQTLKKCIEVLSAVSEREKGEWIPVSSGKLPKIGQGVIATIEYYDGELEVVKTKYDKYGFCCGKATAWMPLPEPYKGGEV